MNISCAKLGEEECERCDIHYKHLEDIHKLDKQELSKPDENGKKTENKHLLTVLIVLVLSFILK